MRTSGLFRHVSVTCGNFLILYWNMCSCLCLFHTPPPLSPSLSLSLLTFPSFFLFLPRFLSLLSRLPLSLFDSTNKFSRSCYSPLLAPALFHFSVSSVFSLSLSLSLYPSLSPPLFSVSCCLSLLCFSHYGSLSLSLPLIFIYTLTYLGFLSHTLPCLARTHTYTHTQKTLSLTHTHTHS